MTIATWGEAMLRLSPPPGQRLAQADDLELHVGGSEANVAVGLATLGVSARWLSVVSDDEPGERVLGELRRFGVDVSRVTRGPGRTGLYFYDRGGSGGLGRPPAVVYYRSHSAFAQQEAGELGAERAGALLAGCGLLHVSGIDLALGQAAARSTASLWEAAGTTGLERSFDVNLRRTLASPERWAAACLPYLATCDVLFVAERDAHALFDVGAGADQDEVGAVLQSLQSLAPHAEIVVTRGGLGAAALAADGSVSQRPALPVADAGRIGRGDAFVAGYLYSRVIEPKNVGAALERGVAAASYKSSLTGDLPVLDAEVVERLRDVAAPGGVTR